MKIPRIAILGMTTTTACADPIIGEWSLASFCLNGEGEEYCTSFPMTEYDSTTSITMIIEDDLSGELTQSASYTDGTEPYSYSVDISVEKESANQYEISWSDSGTTSQLDCNVRLPQLECAFDDPSSNVSGAYTFNKQ